jgi:cytidyltransferase-like protein
METICLLTGGFDPIHSGHLEAISHARSLGDRLIIGANSDAWLARKKGQAFMPITERRAILSSLRAVDEVIEFNDSDGTACDAIQQTRLRYPQAKIIFVNGGDRGKDNVPEQRIQDPNLEFVFGVGGTDKKNSSSWVLSEWKGITTPRPWGHYRVIYDHDNRTKVKELVVEPGQALSMQRHSDRSEFWFVAQGRARVYTLGPDTDFDLLGEYREHDYIWIDNRQWHQLRNETDQPLKIVEIQFGDRCAEDDIERR